MSIKREPFMLEFFAYQTIGCTPAYPMQPPALEPKDIERACNKSCCLACGGELQEIRSKLSCRQCGRINESCCEGSQG